MANNIEIPEETLIRIGFRLLDLMYGELTIKKGRVWNEVFVDKHGVGRLGYDEPKPKKRGVLVYYYKDINDFLRMIPVKVVDYERVLMAWVEERYNKRVDTTFIMVNDIDSNGRGTLQSK